MGKIMTRWMQEVTGGSPTSDSPVSATQTYLASLCCCSKREIHSDWIHSMRRSRYALFSAFTIMKKTRTSHVIVSSMSPNLKGKVTSWQGSCRSGGQVIKSDDSPQFSSDWKDESSNPDTFTDCKGDFFK